MSSCDFCKTNSKIESGKFDLDFLSDLIDPIFIGDKDVGNEATNKLNKRYKLWQCITCNVYWEWRPLYEETMYGGEPGEWIKITNEYVKENYPDVKINGN